MKNIIALAAAATILATSASASWWNSTPVANSDADMSKQAEAQNVQIDKLVGYPSIVNGFEKRMARMLYELRDNPEYKTFSYIVTMQGKFVKICDSIGYGINASVQYSSPAKLYERSNIDRQATFVPQAEPNGLFMPEGLAATYIMCVKDGEIAAVYVEPEVIVSPFELSN